MNPPPPRPPPPPPPPPSPPPPPPRLSYAAAPGEEGGDLLPSSGLVTSSDDYYPTVAINALMRVLRDPAHSSQHLAVIRALLHIFKALSLNAVPYLPKVLPVLFGVLRNGEDTLREEIFNAIRALVGCVRQHMRRFLPDLLALIHEFWPLAPRTCLALMADLGTALKDDFRWVRDAGSSGQARPGQGGLGVGEEGGSECQCGGGAQHCTTQWGTRSMWGSSSCVLSNQRVGTYYCSCSYSCTPPAMMVSLLCASACAAADGIMEAYAHVHPCPSPCPRLPPCGLQAVRARAAAQVCRAVQRG